MYTQRSSANGIRVCMPSAGGCSRSHPPETCARTPLSGGSGGSTHSLSCTGASRRWRAFAARRTGGSCARSCTWRPSASRRRRRVAPRCRRLVRCSLPPAFRSATPRVHLTPQPSSHLTCTDAGCGEVERHRASRAGARCLAECEVSRSNVARASSCTACAMRLHLAVH